MIHKHNISMGIPTHLMPPIVSDALIILCNSPQRPYLSQPFNTPSKDNDDSSSVDKDPEDCEITMPGNDDDDESGVENDEDGDGDEAEDEGDEDGDEEEDPLDVLDEEERKKLLENTLAVRTRLSKVYINSYSLIIILLTITLLRSGNYLLRSSTRQLLHFRHGARPALFINSPSVSFHAMSRLAGTRLTTW